MCEATATAGALVAAGTAETVTVDATVPRARITGMMMVRLMPMIRSSMASQEVSGLAYGLVGLHSTSESSGVMPVSGYFIC
jgi:hypothetical protein